MEVSEKRIENLRRQIKECDDNKPYVFVSYSSKDAEIVYKDIIELQKKGVNIWIDKALEMKAGNDWNSEVEYVLMSGECKIILFYISENSITSPQVCRELLLSKTEDVKQYNNNEVLPIIPVDIEKIPEKNIEKWILRDIMKKYQKESLKNIDSIINGENQTKVRNKFDIARIFLNSVFGKSNAQTRIDGSNEHDNMFIEKLVEIFITRKPEYDDISVVNQNYSFDEDKNFIINSYEKNDLTAIRKSFDSSDSEYKNNVDRLNQRVSNIDKELPKADYSSSIPCMLYGEKFNFSSQSEMMLGIFENVIRRNPDRIYDLEKNLTSISLVDYEIPQNRDNMKAQFRACKTIDVNNERVCIGTSYGLDAKKAQIKKLLEVCKEHPSILECDLISGIQVNDFNSAPKREKQVINEKLELEGDIKCEILGEIYSLKNQAAYMIKVFEVVMKKHPDKIHQIANNLISVSLDDYSNNENKPVYFRGNGKFNVGDEVVFVGTSFSLKDKLNQIKKLLNICGELESDFRYDIKGNKY